MEQGSIIFQTPLSSVNVNRLCTNTADDDLVAQVAHGGCTTAVIGTSRPYVVNGDPFWSPPTAPSTTTTVFDDGVSWTNVTTCEHEIGDDISERYGELFGLCVKCEVEIKLPRIPGGISFERAGKIIGHALAINDDEGAEEVLAEVAMLETEIRHEISRYRDALELVQIAKGTVAKRMLHGTAPTVDR